MKILTLVGDTALFSEVYFSKIIMIITIDYNSNQRQQTSNRNCQCVKMNTMVIIPIKTNDYEETVSKRNIHYINRMVKGNDCKNTLNYIYCI